MKRKPTHGGARKGAGRQPSGRKAYTVRLKPDAMDSARRLAKANELSLSEYLEALLAPF